MSWIGSELCLVVALNIIEFEPFSNMKEEQCIVNILQHSPKITFQIANNGVKSMANSQCIWAFIIVYCYICGLNIKLYNTLK